MATEEGEGGQGDEAAEFGNTETPTFIPPGRSTAAYLSRLTYQMVMEYRNVRQQDLRQSELYRKHLHPDFTMGNLALYDCLVDYCTTGHGAPIGSLAAGKHHSIELYNISAAVRRGTRKAEVYYTTRERAVLSGKLMAREVCNVTFWERREDDGVWQMVRHEALLGPGALGGL